MIDNRDITNIFIIAIIMAIVDIFYLTSMSSFFNSLVQNIQGTKIKLDYISTIIVYLFLVFQLYYFVLKNVKTYTSNYGLLMDAFILGITTYGVYEYTNKAIFKEWTYEATIYDTLWGGVLFTMTALLYKFYKSL